MPIVSGGGGGGLAAEDGAVVTFNGAPPALATGATIPLDTADFDTSSYWDAANHQFLVPSGHGGLFVCSLYVVLAADAAITGAHGFVQISGAAPNLTAPLAKQAQLANTWRGTGAYVVFSAASETMTPVINFAGPATVSLVDATFTLGRIGAG